MTTRSGTRTRPTSCPASTLDLGNHPPVGAESAALLEALGLDLTDPVLAGTPGRMVHGHAELPTPKEFVPTTLANVERYDEMVVARGIPFVSGCEHHMMPFTGLAAVGYLPADQLLGCPNRRGWSTCSPAAPRCRSG